MSTRVPGVTYEQARALVSLARTESYERTRAQLGARSSTSVMHLMTRMAKTLRCGPLVTADADIVRLTAVGRDHLRLSEQLTRAFDDFKRATSEIRFTSYPSHAAEAAEIVAKFDDTHDDAKVIFHNVTDEHRRDRGATMLQEVIDGIADLAIAPSGRARSTLAEHRLYDWTLRVNLPKGHAREGSDGVHLVDLQELEFLVSPRGHRSREEFERLADESEIPLYVAMELMDQNVAARIARSSKRYAAIVPDDAFGPPDSTIGPALLDSAGTPITGSYSLYHVLPQDTDRTAAVTRLALAAELASVLQQEWRRSPLHSSVT